MRLEANQMMANQQTIFFEKQTMRESWVWLVVCFIAGIWIWAFVQQVLFGHPFGNHPVSDAGLIGFGAIPAGLAVLLAAIRLETKISADEIAFRFFPFMLKFRRIAFSEVEKLTIRSYKPMQEFLGWGIRLSLQGKGWGYTIAGNRGLQVHLKNGKKVLLGTAKPDDLGKVISELKSGIQQ